MHNNKRGISKSNEQCVILGPQHISDNGDAPGTAGHPNGSNLCPCGSMTNHHFWVGFFLIFPLRMFLLLSVPSCPSDDHFPQSIGVMRPGKEGHRWGNTVSFEIL